MALPKYTEMRYRLWHYSYLIICASIFIFLIEFLDNLRLAILGPKGLKTLIFIIL